MNQMERSVGFPVNVREMSELKEWDSLKPKINRTIPNAKIAKPMILFISEHAFRKGLQSLGFFPKTRNNLPYFIGMRLNLVPGQRMKAELSGLSYFGIKVDCKKATII